MISNPWNIQAPFDCMFSDIVQYTCQSNNTIAVIDACIFPIEETDPFVDNSLDNETKKLNVLVSVFNMKKNGVDEPKVGDKLKCEDDSEWRVCEVNKELSWFRLTVRQFGINEEIFQ